MLNESRSCFPKEEGATVESRSSAPGMTGSSSPGFCWEGVNSRIGFSPCPSGCKQLVGFVLRRWTEQPKEVFGKHSAWPGQGEVGQLRKPFPWANGGNNAPLSRDRRDTRSRWIAPQKNPPQKEQGPFASGNPINCFRKWKSVPANGAVIDRRFSLRRPSGDKVNSNVI